MTTSSTQATLPRGTRRHRKPVRKPNALPFTVEHPSSNVCLIRLDADSPRWSQRFLLRGDAHHDNPHSNHVLERKHLREASDTDAGIIDVGDLFCAMQGKWDKRSSKRDLRPKHQRSDYLDALVETAADFYEPFAPNWVVMGKGNHETGIKQHHETDLTQRLAATLNDRTGSRVQASGYSGWVRFLIRRGSQCDSKLLWFHHGHGGGGPVTQDLIQDNRRRVYLDGVDVVVTGHTHDRWVHETTKVYLNHHNVVEHRPVYSVKCATYKDEYGAGAGGWHVERGGPPKPLGAWWMTLYRDSQTFRIKFDTAD